MIVAWLALPAGADDRRVADEAVAAALALHAGREKRQALEVAIRDRQRLESARARCWSRSRSCRRRPAAPAATTLTVSADLRDLQRRDQRARSGRRAARRRLLDDRREAGELELHVVDAGRQRERARQADRRRSRRSGWKPVSGRITVTVTPGSAAPDSSSGDDLDRPRRRPGRRRAAAAAHRVVRSSSGDAAKRRAGTGSVTIVDPPGSRRGPRPNIPNDRVFVCRTIQNDRSFVNRSRAPHAKQPRRPQRPQRNPRSPRLLRSPRLR